MDERANKTNPVKDLAPRSASFAIDVFRHQISELPIARCQDRVPVYSKQRRHRSSQTATQSNIFQGGDICVIIVAFDHEIYHSIYLPVGGPCK
jgi:hypothetical protein